MLTIRILTSNLRTLPRESHPVDATAPNRPVRRRRAVVRLLGLAAALLGLAPAAIAQATPRPTPASADSVLLSLGDALRRGLSEGEEVKLADAAVSVAREQVTAAKAGVFPQLSGMFGYTRTIRSPISTGGSFTLPDSLQFRPDSTASVSERLRYLEQRTPSAGLAALSTLFSDLPFGQKNTYVAQLNFTQTLFDASVFSGVAIAREFAQMTESQATEQRLDLALNIIQAYYDALLASRLADITEASTAQLRAQSQQVRLIYAAGNAAELDLLRVEVDLQNIEPQRVAALNQRDVALLNLKRLINVSIDQPVRLTDSLTAVGFQPIAEAALENLTAGALQRRASIAARERERSIRERQVSLAKGAFLPRVSLTANIGTQALPGDFLPAASEFRDDWNAGLAIRVPIFSGGARRADLELARVQLRQTELQLAQLRESVQLDVIQQRGELERANALIRARAQTVAQAERVYSLSNLAYEKGLQTNLQLSDARLQLQQARANEAQALHDYYIALARLLRASGAPLAELAPGATQIGGLR